jgi:hypothetical protein
MRKISIRGNVEKLFDLYESLDLGNYDVSCFDWKNSLFEIKMYEEYDWFADGIIDLISNNPDFEFIVT